ncbi:hypothetical protein BDZ91DRAFT_349804 [Kalaharituber pfeilii]|nr:hypothetical protein BDZ91DRAFT_349804 [Kalaharituber pfeilii]
MWKRTGKGRQRMGRSGMSWKGSFPGSSFRSAPCDNFSAGLRRCGGFLVRRAVYRPESGKIRRLRRCGGNCKICRRGSLRKCGEEGRIYSGASLRQKLFSSPDYIFGLRHGLAVVWNVTHPKRGLYFTRRAWQSPAMPSVGRRSCNPSCLSGNTFCLSGGSFWLSGDSFACRATSSVVGRHCRVLILYAPDTSGRCLLQTKTLPNREYWPLNIHKDKCRI